MSQLLALSLLYVATASAFEVADPLQEDIDPRFFFFNTTGSLIPIDATALLAGIGFLVILTLLGIGIWLLVSSLAPKLAVGGGGYGGYHTGGYGAGHSGGSSYSGYQASMYRQLRAGLLVQLLWAASVARGTWSAAELGSSAVKSAVASPVSRADLSALGPAASGSYVAEPPAGAEQTAFPDYSAYPPYSAFPPYPYPYPYSAYPASVSAPSASDGDTSRLFGSIGSALNPTNLFSCPGGDTSCVVQKIVAGVFILAAIGLAVYLVYALVNGQLGSFSLGRSADPYSAIWDKMSVLDWIAMMEEVYRKFDATSLECQQRLVCELHQNENSWGTTARKMNDAFSYLQYMELLNLPAELRMLLDEYLDAANKGRTSEKTCADNYAGCEFSMKTLISKYNGSNAI